MKKWMKVSMGTIMLSASLVAAAYAGINSIIIHSTKDKIVSLEDVDSADCIIVLGALVFPNRQPSLILEDRLQTALEIYEKGTTPKFLLSGDHGQKDYDEVNTMREYIENNGVEKENIFLDHAGFSTYESIYRAKEIFQAKKVVIVTQEYHLPRALYIAEKLGLDAQGVAADKRTYFKMGQFKLRETLARVKDYVFVNGTKPEPTYLGESIPVSGSGILSQDE